MGRFIKWFFLLSFVCCAGFGLWGCGPALTCQTASDCPPEFPTCKGNICLAKQTLPPTDGGNPDGSGGTCQDGYVRDCYPGDNKYKGIGACVTGQQTCLNGEWGACKGAVEPTKEDCDLPGDEDCDGLVDEGCPCPEGETAFCYRGNIETSQYKPCQPGKQICTKEGVWSSICEGQSLPKKETCNGIDDDCNGQIDDNCACKPGEEKSCYTGPIETVNQGVCQRGTMTCQEDGTWGSCVGAVAPTQELCNQKDDDCDGVIDNGCDCVPGNTQDCYTGPKGTSSQAPCQTGKQTCDAKGKWGSCIDEIIPRAEECNGADDDCNGQIDDNITARPLCDQQQGACKGTTRPCTKTGWGECTAEVYSKGSQAYEPTETICDNQDNDCDGQVDEQLKRNCYSGGSGCTPNGTGFTCQGTCQSGTQECKGGIWEACQNVVKPVTEICNNGKDDDCNGVIDNGCQCKPNESQRCFNGPSDSLGKGPCKQGVQSCQADGRWGPCTGQVVPKAEDCNNIDDDCNGKVDDGLKPPSCSLTNGICQGLTKRCGGAQGWLACSASEYGKHSKLYEPTETKCDGKDNDCDGLVDEGLSRACFGANTGCTKTNSTYKCTGPCQTGVQRCLNAQWSPCRGDIPPAPELCDGKDNDCDGSIDEGNPEGDQACQVAGLKGECAKGLTLCQNNAITCKQVNQPKPEKPDFCTNNKDDDCDGKVDNKCGDCEAGDTRSCFTGNAGCTSQNGQFTCKGICKAGTQGCKNEKWDICVGEVTAKNETCNWQDDDCDGKIDNNGACFYNQWSASTAPSNTTQIAFFDTSKGIAIGNGGKLWRTTDGGAKWTAVTSPTTKDLYAVAVQANGFALVVGADGTLLRSVDYGLQFAKINLTTAVPLYGVAIGSDRYAMAVGGSGTILASQDGAVTWQVQTTPGTQDFYAVTHKYQAPMNAIVVGAAGSILTTTNHGQQWTAATSPTSQPLRHAIWRGVALVSGDNGVLLRSTNGTSWKQQTLPGKKHLTRLHPVANTSDNAHQTFLLEAKNQDHYYLSLDAGQSWHKREFPNKQSFLGLALQNPTQMMAYKSGIANIAKGIIEHRGTQVPVEFRDVAFNNSTSRTYTVAFAIGKSGEVYRSTDDGNTWHQVVLPGSGTVYGVGYYRYSSTDNTAIIVGENGSVFRSTNNGISWSKVANIPTSQTLRSVSIHNSYVVAVGEQGTIIYSTNRGANWTKATAPSPPGPSSALLSVSMKSTTAIAVGENGWVLRSTTSGRTWSNITTNIPNKTLNRVYLYSSSSRAVIVGESGTRLYSLNGGRNWSAVTSGNITQHLFAVGLDSSRGFVGGQAGMAFRLSNSNRTWTPYGALPAIDYYGAMRKYGSNRYLLVGNKGFIAHSTDYAANWTLPQVPGLALHGMTTNGNNQVAVGADGLLLQSSDSGTTWKLIGTPHQATYHALAQHGSICIAVGANGNMARSSNNGGTFSNVTSPTSNTLFAITSPASQQFIAVGATGTIIRSTNNGTSFSTQTSGTNETLRGVDCEGTACLAAGANGSILSSSDTGGTWKTITTPTNETLYAVAFGSAQHAVALGTNGTALYSTNGGQSWTQAQTTNNNFAFTQVRALATQRFVATDDKGRVWLSGNGGKQWSKVSPTLGHPLYGIWVEGNKASIVGAEGTRLLLTSP